MQHPFVKQKRMKQEGQDITFKRVTCKKKRVERFSGQTHSQDSRIANN